MSMPTIDLPQIDLQTALSNVLASIALGEAGLAHILNAEGMKIQTVIANANVTIDDLNTVNESITSLVQGAANIEDAMQTKLNAVISLINPTPAGRGILVEAPATVTPDQPFLDGPISRNSVQTVTFVQGLPVPPPANSWDASAAHDGSVIAWYINIPGALNNVYIAGAGGVRGNPDSRNLFAECANLTSIDFTHFDTVGVTNMDHMFYNDSNLASLDLSGFDTSQVTSMAGMFYGTTGLSTVDLSNFDTSHVDSMTQMFQNSGVSVLNLSSFNTGMVTDMSYMFAATTNLTNLNIGSFDTSKVTTMAGMFQQTGLTSLDLSFFNTDSLLNMHHMFYQSAQLVNVDVSNFNVTNITNMNFAFQGTSALATLDLRHWVTPTATKSEMFQGTNPNLRIYVNAGFNQTYLRTGTGLPGSAEFQIVSV